MKRHHKNAHHLQHTTDGAAEPVRLSLSRRRLLQVASLMPLAALVPRQARAQVQDPIPPPPTTFCSPPRMGSVGIARGQMARLSLFHHMGDLIPCSYFIELTGLDGKSLASDEGQVMPGQGVFFDYDLAAGLEKGDRVQFHADVMIPEDHIGMVGTTLELFDGKSGVTAIPGIPCGIPIPTQGN